MQAAQGAPKTKKSVRDRIVTTAIIIIAVALLSVIFIWFKGNMDREINATTRDYLSKNVNAMAAVFHTKLDDQLVMLESQTRYFKDVDLTDYNLMKKTILSTRGIGTFTSIGVASPAGSTMNYLGKSAGNILLQDYFKEAMEGSPSISAKTISDEHGEEVLVLAVPIMKDGEACGVIYGTFDNRDLSALLNAVHFDEASSNILVTGDGTILAASDDSGPVNSSMENISELIPGIAPLDGAKDQFFKFTCNGVRSILVLTPIGEHDWYFGTILPEHVLTDEANRISGNVMIVILLILAVFTFLTIYIVSAGRKNERVKRDLGDKASKDSLTQILNKMAFQAEVQKAIDENNGSFLFVMCMFDLDNFKHVNDTYGHAAGDAVIIETAQRLKRVFRDGDLIGRVGGDEFSVFIMCPKSEVADPEVLISSRAEAVLREMRAPFICGEKEVVLSSSAGFAYYPDHGEDYQTLYRNADEALYTAKQGGKDRYEIYSQTAH